MATEYPCAKCKKMGAVLSGGFCYDCFGQENAPMPADKPVTIQLTHAQADELHHICMKGWPVIAADIEQHKRLYDLVTIINEAMQAAK